MGRVPCNGSCGVEYHVAGSAAAATCGGSRHNNATLPAAALSSAPASTGAGGAASHTPTEESPHPRFELMIARGKGDRDRRFGGSGIRMNGGTTVEAEPSFYPPLEALPEGWYFSNTGPGINLFTRVYNEIYGRDVSEDAERRQILQLPGHVSVGWAGENEYDGGAWGPDDHFVPEAGIRIAIETEIGMGEMDLGEPPAETGLVYDRWDGYVLENATPERFAAAARWVDERVAAAWRDAGETPDW